MPNYRNQVDYDWIEQQLAAASIDVWDCRVVCLPAAMVHVLRGFAEQLSWRATYLGGHDYSTADWDIIEGLAHAADHSLRCDMSCDELVGAVQGATTNLYEPRSSGNLTVYPVGDDTTNPDASTVTATDPSTFPVTTVTDPDGSGVVTQDEVDTLICNLAETIADMLIWSLKNARFMHQVGMGVEKLLDFLIWQVIKLAAAVTPVPQDDVVFWGLDEFTSLYLDYWEDLTLAQLDAAIASFEAARQDIKCAIADGNTVSEIVGIVEAQISIYAGALAVSTWLVSLPWSVIVGLGMLGKLAFTGTGCDCGGSLWSEFTDFGTLDDGWGSWSNNGTLFDDGVSIKNSPQVIRLDIPNWDNGNQVTVTVNLSNGNAAVDHVIDFRYGGSVRDTWVGSDVPADGTIYNRVVTHTKIADADTTLDILLRATGNNWVNFHDILVEIDPA